MQWWLKLVQLSRSLFVAVACSCARSAAVFVNQCGGASFNSKNIINVFNMVYASCNFRSLYYACHVISYVLFIEHAARDPLCNWHAFDLLHRNKQQHAVESPNAPCRLRDTCSSEHLSMMLLYLCFVFKNHYIVIQKQVLEKVQNAALELHRWSMEQKADLCTLTLP